jgi:hypothetical protein
MGAASTKRRTDFTPLVKLFGVLPSDQSFVRLRIGRVLRHLTRG